MASWSTKWLARLIAVIVVGQVGLASTEVRGDRIVLRGGTVLRGVILPQSSGSDQYVVQTESGQVPLKFPKAQVTKIEREPSALDDYLPRLQRLGNTATGQQHYELGIWCESKRLTGLARSHFERAVELDPKLASAHKKLGHVEHDGQWVSVSELKNLQGLVQYKGKWVTAEERKRLEDEAAESVEQTSWTRRLRILRAALRDNNPNRRAEAENQLLEIRDAAAVRPLVRAFANDPPVGRGLMTRSLAGIPGRDSTLALVNRVLAEPELEIRQIALDQLAQRKTDDPGIVRSFSDALDSKNPVVVARSAWALAGLEARSCVPKLVKSLVKVEQHMTWEVEQGPSPFAGPLPAGPIVFPTPATTGAAGSNATNSANANTNGNNINQMSSGALLTGPVVGPGIVAYGATSVPVFGNGVGLGYQAQKMPQPRMVVFQRQNPDVLDALNRLTGKNFGYDISAWRHWLGTEFQPEPIPARRVPQP